MWKLNFGYSKQLLNLVSLVQALVVPKTLFKDTYNQLIPQTVLTNFRFRFINQLLFDVIEMYTEY